MRKKQDATDILIENDKALIKSFTKRRKISIYQRNDSITEKNGKQNLSEKLGSVSQYIMDQQPFSSHQQKQFLRKTSGPRRKNLEAQFISISWIKHFSSPQKPSRSKIKKILEKNGNKNQFIIGYQFHHIKN